MPEDFIAKIKNNIKKEWRLAFLAALIIGFFTHMYVFTNMLPNHDGLINTYNTQLKFKSGRFFLGPFSGISSFFDLPWVIGTLSIIYLAFMTVLVIELFELRKSISIILSAGLIVTFPTVGATFSYIFTADGYMVGNLLAVLAVLITIKYSYGFLPAAFIFYISVGIYQANLTVALCIGTIWLIYFLLLKKGSVRNFCIFLLRLTSMTIIGMAFYAVTFKSYQYIFKGEITDYQGIDKIGTSSGSLLDQLIKIKDSSLDFFYRGFFTDYPVKLFEILNVGFLIILLIIITALVLQTKLLKQPVKLISVLICILSLPISVFILYFVSPGVQYHMLMVMALVFIYLLPIVIYDKLETPSNFNKVYSWTTLLLTSLIIFNFALINNIAYFNMSLKYERSYAMVNRIIDRIEQTEGYENATKLAIYGRINIDSNNVSQKVAENIPLMTGAMADIILSKPYHYQYMLANFYGKSFDLVSNDTRQSLQNSSVFKQLKAWPSKDSIVVYGDTVVVKLSD